MPKIKIQNGSKKLPIKGIIEELILNLTSAYHCAVRLKNKINTNDIDIQHFYI